MEVKPRSNTHIYLHNKTNQKQNKCPSPNLRLLKRQGSVLSHTFLFFLFFSTLAQWDLCSRFSGPFWRLSCVFCFLNCWDISSVSCLLHSLRSDPPSAPQSAEGQREEEASASQSLPRAAFFFLSSRGTTTKTNKSNSHFCKSPGNSFFQSSHSLICLTFLLVIDPMDSP